MNSEMSNDPAMLLVGAHVMSCFVKVTPVEFKGSDSATERWNLSFH